MTNNPLKIVGFDPGRDKCGIAVVESAINRNKTAVRAAEFISQPKNQLLYHDVVASEIAVSTIDSLAKQFAIATIVMGDRTTAKQWREKFQKNLSSSITIEMIDEHNSSVEARDRYWQMYPPKGLQRLIPQGMRVPPRPIDDIVAILLIERYLEKI
jgi:RNase H-fold protein (predicted Holliday junction resolvase)